MFSPLQSSRIHCVSPVESVRKYQIMIVEEMPGMRSHLANVVNQVSATMPAEVAVVDWSEGMSLAQEQPDLLVLDPAGKSMIDGMMLAGDIWRIKPATKILFWPQVHREVFWYQIDKISDQSAVYGYVPKSHSDAELKAAITSLLVYANTFISPELRQERSRVARRGQALTEVDMQTLEDICLGLTDRAIALRRGISVRGVHNRVLGLESKLLRGRHALVRYETGVDVFNPRMRAMFEGLRRGLVDIETLKVLDAQLSRWLEVLDADD